MMQNNCTKTVPYCTNYKQIYLKPLNIKAKTISGTIILHHQIFVNKYFYLIIDFLVYKERSLYYVKRDGRKVFGFDCSTLIAILCIFV